MRLERATYAMFKSGPYAIGKDDLPTFLAYERRDAQKRIGNSRSGGVSRVLPFGARRSCVSAAPAESRFLNPHAEKWADIVLIIEGPASPSQASYLIM